MRKYSEPQRDHPRTRLLDLPSVPGRNPSVKVLFFGSLRDIAGSAQETLELASLASPVSLGTVFEHYAQRFPRLREMRQSIVMALNQQFSHSATLVSDQDEIAMLPPVSGGSGKYHSGKYHLTAEPDGGHFFGLTRERIDAEALANSIQAGSDGAVITFEGIVRDNTKGRRTLYLEYEGYEAMAIRIMEELGLRIAAEHSIGRLAIVHRLGRLEIGEASVVIVACAPHRRPAFTAALDAIDSLKRTVPIWKKEYFEDGEVWVEGEWDTRLRAQTI